MNHSRQSSNEIASEVIRLHQCHGHSSQIPYLITCIKTAIDAERKYFEELEGGIEKLVLQGRQDISERIKPFKEAWEKEIFNLTTILREAEETLKSAEASIGIWHDAYLQLIDGAEEGAPDIPSLAISQQRHTRNMIDKTLATIQTVLKEK